MGLVGGSNLEQWKLILNVIGQLKRWNYWDIDGIN